MKPLTHRQTAFLRTLIQLHQQHGVPIHYSELANQLGVGKVTAYEMLRLLEKRGLAEAQYRRPEDRQGPGRASVVFLPTPEAIDSQPGQEVLEQSPGEWEIVRSRILERLQSTKVAGYDALLEDLVSRLQPQRSPVVYLAEMVTAFVLGLHSIREDLEARGMRNFLSNIGLPSEGGLSALGGLGAGLSMVERLNKRIAEAFQVQVSKYHSLLADLSSANRRRLAEFTQELLEIVTKEPHITAEGRK